MTSGRKAVPGRGGAAADEERPARSWVLASGNPGKAREFEALLAPCGISLVLQGRLGIGEAEEPHPTFVENALAKARHAGAGSGLTALADDSGICVPALGGVPGVRSARYSEPQPGWTREQVDEANNRKLLREAADLGAPVACFYYCVVVLLRHAADPRPLISEGVWPGELVTVGRGGNGFGYDPHFLPAGEVLTAAEMEPGRKNQVSHRARALAALVAALTAEENGWAGAEAGVGARVGTGREAGAGTEAGGAPARSS